MTKFGIVAVCIEIVVSFIALLTGDFEGAAWLLALAFLMVLALLVQNVKDGLNSLGAFQARVNAETLAGVSEYATALEDRIANALDIDYGQFTSTTDYKLAVHAALKGETK